MEVKARARTLPLSGYSPVNDFQVPAGGRGPSSSRTGTSEPTFLEPLQRQEREWQPLCPCPAHQGSGLIFQVSYPPASTWGCRAGEPPQVPRTRTSTQLSVSVLPRTAAQVQGDAQESVVCGGSGKARGGAWFHTVGTQGPRGLGKRPQKQSGDL